MTIFELSKEYRQTADTLRTRVRELTLLQHTLTDERELILLEERIRILTSMWRDTRDIAVVLAHYYDRGYRRNDRYTI